MQPPSPPKRTLTLAGDVKVPLAVRQAQAADDACPSRLAEAAFDARAGRHVGGPLGVVIYVVVGAEQLCSDKPSIAHSCT